MSSALKLLVIEDSEDDALLIVESLRDAGWNPAWQRVDTEYDLRTALRTQTWDLATADYQMPAFSAPEALRVLSEAGSDVPFIVVSGSIGEEQAVALMRNGAHDFFLKDRLRCFPAAVAREVREAKIRQERSRAEQKILRQAEELRKSHADLESKNAQLQKTTQQLLRSNADLQRFAYAAAHDLLEPLRNVATSAELLDRLLPKGTVAPEVESLLQTCVDGARRMHDMVTALLDYTRVSGYSTPVSLTNSENALRRAIGNLGQAVRESNAEITFDSLPPVLIEEVHLVQVFQNVVANSLKYRSSERRPVIHISARRDEADYVFSIRDNGIGFDPRYAEQIFGLFKRLHTTEAYSGTGMGLAICSRIVEQYGGRMWASGEPQRGATFFFRLPAKGND